MTFRWSESALLEFLDHYRSHACLWDFRTETYSKKGARDKAMREIIEKMALPDLTIPDVKNKIKSIRTMYKKEFSLVCKNTGYEPRLFWYKKADAFLNAVMKISPELYLQHFDTMEPVTTIKIEIDDDYELPPVSTEHTNNKDLTAEGSYEYSQHSELNDCNPTPQNRKRKCDDATDVDINQYAEVVQKTREETEWDIFGKHVAVQLMKMPEYDAVMCQEQIQKLILDKRLEIMKRPKTEEPSLNIDAATPSPNNSFKCEPQDS